MALGDIARWLWRGKDSKRQLRPFASMPVKAKPSRSTSFPPKAKTTEDDVPRQRTTRYGRKRLGKVDQRRVDTEIDGFVLPAERDGDGDDWTTCSVSDESDWSIGWFEPLSSGFQGDDSDNSFGVLVPCYGPSSRKVLDSRGKQNENTRILDNQKYVEKWLESLKR